MAEYRLSFMKPEPPKIEKDLGNDLKTFEQLPAKTKELELLKDQAEKATGQRSVALNEMIRDKSKQGTPRLSGS